VRLLFAIAALYLFLFFFAISQMHFLHDPRSFPLSLLTANCDSAFRFPQVMHFLVFIAFFCLIVD